MKKLLLILLCFVICINPQINLFGQQLKSFQIKSPFKRSTYDGIMIKKMKPKQLKEIISSSSDPDAIRYFNSARLMGNVGTALFVLGTIGLAGSLIGDINDVNTVNSGRVNVGSSNGLRLASAAIFLAGIGFNVSSNSFLKKSVNNYNKSVSVGKSNSNQMPNPYGITELITFKVTF